MTTADRRSCCGTTGGTTTRRPEVFFRALRRLDHDGVAFRLALAGANVRSDPREFVEAEERFVDRLVHVGHLDRERYLELLVRSSVVASTAVHEFFGIAMVEAMAAGLVPLLPRALSYPELVARGVPRRRCSTTPTAIWCAGCGRCWSTSTRPGRRSTACASRCCASTGPSSGRGYDAALAAVRVRRAARRGAALITDVDGVRVGHWTDAVARTGCTVVLLPDGTTGSAEVRGGAPATRGARRAGARAGSSTGSTRSC